MQKNIYLPNVELNMESVAVTGWLVAVGDLVAADQPLLEVETQKATIEVPSPEAGYVRELHVAAGDSIGEKALLCVLTDAIDESFADPHAPTDEAAPVEREQPEPAAGGEPSASGIVPAAPAARKLAKELDVDLARLTGTGPGGRITLEDVQAASTSTTAAATKRGEWTPLPASRIALNSQMQKSLAEIPQIQVARQLDVTPLLRKAEGITFTHRLVVAVAHALAKHAELRTIIRDNSIMVQPVSVAIAMDTPHGLVAPVLRGADALSLKQIAAAVKEFQSKATANTLSRRELLDGPFAITNLGMYGVDFFQPFVFHGQTAVLAVARAVDAADGGKVAWFSLAADHRVVDGVTAARFLQSLQERILVTDNS